MPRAVEAAPGLYLRGPEAVDRPVVDTAVAGFVGISERGPIGVPQPLRSLGEYLQVFGRFVPYGHLAECVYAFFQNGGEKCWAVRAADDLAAGQPGPCPPDERLAEARFGPLPDANGADALEVAALDEGGWGNEIAFAIDAESTRDMVLTKLRAPAAATDTVLNVESVLDITSGATIQIASAANTFVQARHDVASVDTVNRQVTITDPAGIGAPFPKGSTLSGRGFRLAVQFREDSETFDHLSMTPDHPRYAPNIVNDTSNRLSYIDRRRRGHSVLVRVTHLQPGGIPSGKPAATPALDGSDGSPPHSLSGGGDGFISAKADLPLTPGPGSIEMFARSDRGTSAHDIAVTVAPFETVTALPVPIVPGGPRDEVMVEDADTLFVGDNLTLTFTAADGTETTSTSQIQTLVSPNRVAVTPNYTADFPVGSRATIQDRFDLLVHRGEDPEPVERHLNLSGNPVHARAYHLAVQNDSTLLCTGVPLAPVALAPASRPLSGGRDPGMIDYSFYTGYATDGTPLPDLHGLAALETVTEVCVVALPDLHRVEGHQFPRGQRHLLNHCERTGSRFALLDPPPPRPGDDADAEILRIESWPLHFRNRRDAKNGALYFPWVTGDFKGSLREVTPSGFVAGYFADSDRRRGVGKAPANARLMGIVDLAATVDRQAQGRLNPSGVNCIRKFEDGQVRLFGARTVSADPRWTFVNVRRVLLSVVKALSHNMLWAVFEPSDDRLLRRIETTLTSYLTTLVSKGVTAGTGAKESFYVKCNAETNPPEEKDAGRVIAEIGLAVAAPAEFIVITVRKTPDALSIVEEDV